MLSLHSSTCSSIHHLLLLFHLSRLLLHCVPCQVSLLSLSSYSISQRFSHPDSCFASGFLSFYPGHRSILLRIGWSSAFLRLFRLCLSQVQYPLSFLGVLSCLCQIACCRRHRHFLHRPHHQCLITGLCPPAPEIEHAVTPLLQFSLSVCTLFDCTMSSANAILSRKEKWSQQQSQISQSKYRSRSIYNTNLDSSLRNSNTILCHRRTTSNIARLNVKWEYGFCGR